MYVLLDTIATFYGFYIVSRNRQSKPFSGNFTALITSPANSTQSLFQGRHGRQISQQDSRDGGNKIPDTGGG